MEVSNEFKKMVQVMTAFEPAFRLPMVDLLGHDWMRG